MDRLEPACPACGSPRVILVASEALGSELAELEREGWAILDACPVGENEPDRRCHTCGYEWIEPGKATRPI